MNQTINQTFSPAQKPPFEISAWKIRWLVAFTFATIGLAREYYDPSSSRTTLYSFHTNPAFTAAGVTIAEGIDEFSGTIGETPYARGYYYIFLCLVVVWIVGPTILLFSGRYLSSENMAQAEPHWGRRVMANIGFVIGGFLVLAILIPSIPQSVQVYRVYQSIQKGQAIKSHKDDLLGSCVAMVNYDAYQYKILPRELGGGGNSYEGYRISAGTFPDDISRKASVIIEEISPNKITVRVDSKMYPGASIENTLDSSGVASGYAYTGIFQ